MPDIDRRGTGTAPRSLCQAHRRRENHHDGRRENHHSLADHQGKRPKTEGLVREGAEGRKKGLGSRKGVTGSQTILQDAISSYHFVEILSNRQKTSKQRLTIRKEKYILLMSAEADHQRRRK